MGNTLKSVQLGGPQSLKMSRQFAAAGITWMISPVKVPLGHYWMIDRIACVAWGNSMGSTPFIAFFHAPGGVTENPAGSLSGIPLPSGATFPISDSLTLLDAAYPSMSGGQNNTPFMVADEAKAIYVPEGRVIVIYATQFGTGNLFQVDFQYTDWVATLPVIGSTIPVVESTDTDE
jgi:hypothetical protein